MEGIKNRLEPPACMEELSKKEIKNSEVLPRTLHEAVRLFKKDSFIQEVLGRHISGQMAKAKDLEWNEYCKQVTLWETEHYLSTI